jgi:hypothetical protein
MKHIPITNNNNENEKVKKGNGYLIKKNMGFD